jgi:hypothetical protein
VGWRETLAKFSARGSAREDRCERKAADLAHAEAVGGRIEKPAVGDLIRLAGELSTVRPATLHGYAKSLRFIVSEMLDIPHTEQAPALKCRSGRKPRTTDRVVRGHDATSGEKECPTSPAPSRRVGLGKKGVAGACRPMVHRTREVGRSG